MTASKANLPQPEAGRGRPRFESSYVFRFTGPPFFAYGDRMREVGEIMTPRVVAIGAQDRLLTVEDIMTLGRLRHLPVVRLGQLVGVISESDLLRASPSCLELQDVDERRNFLNSIEVWQAMSSPPIVIDAKASLFRAADLMLKREIGCLPVTDDSGEMRGMLSREDVLASMSGRG